jgi:transposase
MRMAVDTPDVYLHHDHVNFRKQINGLTAIVEIEMKQSPNTGVMFLFYRKRRDKLKLLYWDKTGFCLWYKCLESNKFKWLKNMS